MNIKLLDKKRLSENKVEVTYKLDDDEFTVIWSNASSGGSQRAYDLQTGTRSSNTDLAKRIDQAILDDLTDSVEPSDLELYEFLNNNFDSFQVACFEPVVPFKIIREEMYSADHFSNNRYLTELGGCYGTSNSYGLGDWQYEFDVEVTNQAGETKQFTVVLQPEERTNGLMAYSGYNLSFAGSYGCDADESSELEKFCDYDVSVLNALHDKTSKQAKKEYERLIGLLEAGDIVTEHD